MRTLKENFPNKKMINPNGYVKCKGCKLLRRAWQLNVKKRGYPQTNIYRLQIECPNCKNKDIVIIAKNDTQFKICRFETFDQCAESVSFCSDAMRYVPEEFRTDELELMSKLS